MKHPKSGAVLVELVVALGIIMLVSFTALSIVLSAATSRKNSSNRLEAIRFAETMWTCFRASDSQDDFLDNAAFASDVSLTDSAADDSYTFSADNNSFHGQIQVRFSDTEADAFSISVLDHKDREIVSFSFTKGGGS